MTADRAPRRTIADVYADRELTDTQVRRIVALLGLHQAVRSETSEQADRPEQQSEEAA